MFDLSWSHIGLFVVIALLVLGPKELPNAIRTGAQLLRTGRKLAGEFRGGLDELMREAELDETRRSIKQAMTEGLDKTIDEHVDPAGEIKSSLESPAIESTASLELAGPPNPAEASVVINDPPPAPPNSIVPPPPEELVQAIPAEPPPPADDSVPEKTATDSDDLKKSA